MTRARGPASSSWRRGRAARALELLGLGAFALAQPLFDLLARHAEFFAVRRSEPLDVVLLTLCLAGLWCVPWLALQWLGGLASPRVASGLQSVAVGLLATLLASLGLKAVGDLPGAVHVALAALLGVAAAVAHARAALGGWLLLLSPGGVAFPVLFLLQAPVAGIVFPRDPGAAGPVAVRAEAPVVMVIFDELPLTALLDARGRIDAVRYPGFAALAERSTWFRNATTVSVSTPQAVPAILTGRYPDPAKLPTATDHPESLFTLLGGAYRVAASGPIRGLCPESLCHDPPPPLLPRLALLFGDVGVLYLHLVAPAAWAERLPSIEEKWMGFGRSAAAPAQPSSSPSERIWAAFRGDLSRDRMQQFRSFLDSIQPGAPPTLYFLHILLPHGPYNYLPSGKAYNSENDLTGVVAGSYLDDEWAVTQTYQRHLLQTGSVDVLIGELLARLRAAGLYDAALIVVTADHGVSFRAGDKRRNLTESNVRDILPVPLLVKAPGQREGRISDRNVETIDVLPTVAELLGIELPWSVDGRSALAASAPERAVKRVVSGSGSVREYPAELPGRDAALRRKLRLFGAGAPERLFRIGPYGTLAGRPVAELPLARPRPLALQVDHAGLYQAVDPDATFVPALVTGRLGGAPDPPAPHLAIALNGTVRAVTRPYRFPVGGAPGRFAAVVAEDAFVPGPNRLEIFAVEGDPAAPRLAKVASESYRLARDDGAEAIVSSAGRRIPIVPGALRGSVGSAVTELRLDLWGWAVDEPNGELPESILVFVEEELLHSGRTEVSRPELAARLDNPALELAGFVYRMPRSPLDGITDAAVRVFAVSGRGVASELEYQGGYLWD